MLFPNEFKSFAIVESAPMSRSFLGALAEQAKRTEAKIISARCSAPNRFVSDEVVNLTIIINMSE
jgi:hypothetical protein